MSSEEEEVVERPWWCDYCCYTPEQLEEELRDTTISNFRRDEEPGKVFVNLANTNPLVDAIRINAIMPGDSGWGLCLMDMRDLEEILTKLLEEFAREVPEDARLEYVEIWKKEEREELLERISDCEELSTKYVELIVDRPQSPDTIPLDSVWGDVIYRNRDRGIGPVTEHDACYSVTKEALDMIEESFKSQIDECTRRIEESKRTLDAGMDFLWRCQQELDKKSEFEKRCRETLDTTMYTLI
jgi:hypothetical protein